MVAWRFNTRVWSKYTVTNELGNGHDNPVHEKAEQGEIAISGGEPQILLQMSLAMAMIIQFIKKQNKVK